MYRQNLSFVDMHGTFTFSLLFNPSLIAQPLVQCRQLAFCPDSKTYKPGYIGCWLSCDGPVPQYQNKLHFQIWIGNKDSTKSLVHSEQFSTNIMSHTALKLAHNKLPVIADRKVIGDWEDNKMYGQNSWIPLSDLTASNATFVKNNILQIGVHISSVQVVQFDAGVEVVVHAVNNIFVAMQSARTEIAPSTAYDFTHFYNNTAFSDIVLKAQRTKVHAHKVVLAAHSPAREAMLQVT